jgi:hypothetical protein
MAFKSGENFKTGHGEGVSVMAQPVHLSAAPKISNWCAPACTNPGASPQNNAAELFYVAAPGTRELGDPSFFQREASGSKRR